MTTDRLEGILRAEMDKRISNLLEHRKKYKKVGDQSQEESIPNWLTSLLFEIFSNNEWGKYAQVVLEHPQGVSELNRLINEGWHFLYWPYPLEYPNSELVAAIFKAPLYDPPYPFIVKGNYIIEIEESYRTRSCFQDIHFCHLEKEEDIRQGNELLGLTHLKETDSGVFKSDIHFAITESLSWFRACEHEYV